MLLFALCGPGERGPRSSSELGREGLLDHRTPTLGVEGDLRHLHSFQRGYKSLEGLRAHETFLSACRHPRCRHDVRSNKLGDGSIDKRLKEVTARASEDLGLEEHRVTSSKGEKRYSRFTYPTRIPEDDITRDVFLQDGDQRFRYPRVPSVRGAFLRLRAPPTRERRDHRRVRRADVARSQGARSRSGEQLVEKLALLNALGEGSPDDLPMTSCAPRGHVYDIAALLSPGDVRTRLESSPTMIRDLAPGGGAHQPGELRYGHAAHPAGGFGESVVFAVGNAACEALRQSYEGNLPSLVYKELRPFDGCLEMVRSSAHLL